MVVGPLLYHAATDTVSGGILGIDLFFTLSSFLIISIALNEFEATGRIDLKAYAGRRARRLLPALFLALGMLTLYLVLVVPPSEIARWTGAIFSTLTYSANWYEIFSDTSYFEDFHHSPLRHVWSFSIEEQFYIFAPLYLIAVLTLFRRRANLALLVTMVAGTILSTWWMSHLYPGHGDPSRVYYGTDTRAHSLFAGIILAVAVRMYGPVRTRAGQLVWVAGAYGATIFFSWAIFEISERDAWMFEYGGFLLVAAVSCLMIYGVAQPGERAWHSRLPSALSADDAPWASRLVCGALYAGLFTAGWAVVSVARGNTPFDHWPYLLGVGIGWFCYGVDRPTVGPLHWFLESRLIRWVGKISYGLYLYHWPIYLLVTPTRAALLVPGVSVIEGLSGGTAGHATAVPAARPPDLGDKRYSGRSNGRRPDPGGVVVGQYPAGRGRGVRPVGQPVHRAGVAAAAVRRTGPGAGGRRLGGPPGRGGPVRVGRGQPRAHGGLERGPPGVCRGSPRPQADPRGRRGASG